MSINAGFKIRKIRELKDITQAHMADLLGISQSYYAKIEGNQVDLTFKKLEAIAKVLEIEPLQLLQFDGAQYIHSVTHSQVGSGQYIDQRDMSSATNEQYRLQIEELKEELRFLRSLVEKVLHP